MNAKKILALLLGAMMLLSLAACGAKGSDKQAGMSGGGSAMTSEPKTDEEALPLPKELLEQVSEMVHKYKAPLFTHISETRTETDECLERYGMTPPQFLDSLGLFDYGGGGYHCVYFTEEDMDLFAKKGLHIITNPGSNTKLASGVAPITRFLEKGINVGIGTDGASSNNCLDMFRLQA